MASDRDLSSPSEQSRGSRRQGSAATVATNFPKNRKVKTTALFHGRVKGETGHSRTNTTAACSRRPGTSSSSPAVREERQERQEPVSLPSPPGRNPSIIQFGKNLINKIKRKENGPGGPQGERGQARPRRPPPPSSARRRRSVRLRSPDNGAGGCAAPTTLRRLGTFTHAKQESLEGFTKQLLLAKRENKGKAKVCKQVESHGGETVRS